MADNDAEKIAPAYAKPEDRDWASYTRTRPMVDDHNKPRPNAPVAETLAGVQCFTYPAEQYAAVDADVADERKGGRPAGAVARQMALWAGIRSAENLKWMLNELLADMNRQSFRESQISGALKNLLFALHARPRHGYPLLPVEDAIANANELLDSLRDKTHDSE